MFIITIERVRLLVFIVTIEGIVLLVFIVTIEGSGYWCLSSL